MKPPENAELFDTLLASYWFDEYGILCGNSKKGERSIENYQQVVDFYKSLTLKGNKHCLLADSVHSVPMTKEITNFIAAEYPKYLKALAIISNAPFENSQINAFLKLTFADFPVMMFSTEEEARKWVKDYL